MRKRRRFRYIRYFRNIRYFRLIMLTTVVIAICGGCSLLESQSETTAIDPPPPGANVDARDSAQVATTERMLQTVIYYLDDSDNLVPLTAKFRASEERPVEQLVRALADRQQLTPLNQLPAGFREPLPAGTSVRAVAYVPAEQLVTIDLSPQFGQYRVRDERKVVEAVVWTLTELPGIRQIRLSLSGTPLSVMPAAGLPLPERLTRAFALNLHDANPTNIGRTIPISLFYQRRTDAGYAYFVPLTRFVAHTEERARAVLRLLQTGPQRTAEAQFVQLLSPTLRVRDVTTQDGHTQIRLTDDRAAGELSGDARQSLLRSLLATSPEQSPSIVFGQSQLSVQNLAPINIISK